MARNQSADEVRQEHLDRLGPRLGPLYHALYNDWAWLLVKWQEYVELFGTNARRVEVANEAAPLFFRIVQQTLEENILLHLVRLTDPPSSMGKDNLTIRRLPDALEDKAVKAELQSKIDAALAATEFARDWRNRRLAHHDLALALDDGAHPIAPASRLKFRQAIDALHDVLRCLNVRVLNSDLANEVLTGGDGAVALLYVIQDGLDAAAAREERIRSGQYVPDDFKPPRAV